MVLNSYTKTNLTVSHVTRTYHADFNILPTSKMSGLNSCFIFERSCLQILAWRRAITTEHFYTFPQSYRAHLHLVPRLRMHGATILLPSAFTACTRTTLPLLNFCISLQMMDLITLSNRLLPLMSTSMLFYCFLACNT